VGRIALVGWDGGGNVPPMVALGVRLAARGHDVSGHGPGSMADRFRDAGLGFEVLDTAEPWRGAATAAELAAHVGALGVDTVVSDYMLPGALCGAEASGGRSVALVHTLHGALLAGGDHPHPMAMAAGLDTVNGARDAVGLAPVGSLGALLDRADRVLVTSPAALDLPREPAGNVVHVGPVFEPAGSDAGWEPPPGDDPLVVVSLGTTPMDEAPVLQAVLDGLDGAPVRVLVMCGPHLDGTELRLPSDATRTGLVRHGAVLPHASVVVDHGGLGTVLAALAHGLPQVCIPLGREQPENAEAVERVGAGVRCPPDAGPAQLGAAVLAALTDPSLRERADALAATFGGPASGERAAAEVAALVTA
jgi:UDP:flavonoid glycosyltransferase YjiC (YdhE family)